MRTRGRKLGDGEAVRLADRLALRLPEAAAVLGVSDRTLRSLVPELPHIRRGRVLLFPVESLQAWLRDEARTEKARADAIAEEIASSVKAD